jgi:hypothetical protein
LSATKSRLEIRAADRSFGSSHTLGHIQPLDCIEAIDIVGSMPSEQLK